jgi:hypothetical protein
MATRFFVASILGAVVMFIWTSVAHMVLPLGQIGVREIPNEQAVTAAMQRNITKPGFYIFPGLGLGDKASSEQRRDAMKSMAARFAESPSGILIYHPPGKRFQLGRHLVFEFVTELIEAMLVMSLLCTAKPVGASRKISFALMVGLLAAIATNVPYRNWYGFPANYTVSYMAIEIVGFVCLGIVGALVLGDRTSTT